MRPDWEKNGIQLYCADCMDVLPHLSGVDAVVTDPPYGIGWKRGINRARYSKPHDGILGDEDTSARDEALRLLGDIPGVVFGSFYADFPKNIKQICVWKKPPDSGLVGSVTGFRRDAEPIFLIGKWPVRTCEKSSVFITLKGQSAIVTETGHPHTKPSDLMETLVELCPGEIICDPFMGSGTTGVACVRLGRKFIGIERERKWFDIAVKRIERALSEERSSLFPVAKEIQKELI